MARGGARAGAPGKSYSNRSDLNQAVKVAPGQPYGQRQQLEQAQQAVPLPNAQNLPAAPTQAAGPSALPQGGPMPALPGAQPFTRPTERPNEPVTTGLPVGAGAGPEALSTSAPDTIGAQLVAMYRQNPNNDLLRLIELHNRGF